MTVLNCERLQFPRFRHEQGSICSIESGANVPFDIKRIFYLYDVAAGESRGAHAHFQCHQVLVCVSGSLSVNLDDGRERATVLLNRPWFGLHIPPMVWAEEVDFDPGTVCLVLTSAVYDESDYIRNYDDYVRLIRERDAV